MATQKGKRAVLLGGTGATGSYILGYLLTRPAWEEVTVVGRRDAQAAIPDKFKDAGLDLKRLKSVVVPDVRAFLESPNSASAFKGADAVFTALGTTRAVAGSAEAFRAVDLHSVSATAAAAKAAGARHFSLISAQGANKNLWASDFVLFHALLYCRVKGLAEEAARQQGFPSLSIYRPGLLLRGDMARGIERFMALIPGVGLQVDALALAAVKDAERRLEGAGDAQPVVTVFEGNGRILRASKDPDAA